MNATLKKNKIVGYRRICGMTQDDVAELFDISRQAYWKKENGRTPFTDNEKVLFKKKIEKIIPEIKIDDIFFE